MPTSTNLSKQANLICQKSREERYGAVRAVLEDNVKLRDRAESRFQSFFEQNIHRLHNDLRVEAEVGWVLWLLAGWLDGLVYRFICAGLTYLVWGNYMHYMDSFVDAVC